MSVKDEADIAQMILKKPCMAASVMTIAGAIAGSSTSCAPSATKVVVEEVRKEEFLARPSIRAAEARDIRECSNVGTRLAGLSVPETRAARQDSKGFEARLESFFSELNELDALMSDASCQAGRVGERMKEEWDKAVKRLKLFEFYADRTLQRLEE